MGGVHVVKALDPCAEFSPCRSGSTCEWLDELSPDYECMCLPGWAGKHCSVPIPNACDPSPCHDGTCMSSEDAPYYTCSCPQGSMGSNCEPIPGWRDACDPHSPCRNGGECMTTPTPPFFSCSCSDGFKGHICDTATQDPCSSSPCNFGTCVQQEFPPYFSCACPDEFDGYFCENCSEGHFGPLCRNECACIHGRCDPHSGACYCFQGYEGPDCELSGEPRLASDISWSGLRGSNTRTRGHAGD
jgi:hypothetical protein